MTTTNFCGKCYKSRDLWGFWKFVFWKKNTSGTGSCTLLSPPPKKGYNCCLFYFFDVFMFFASSNIPIKLFIGFLNTLLKHLATSCSNNHHHHHQPPPKNGDHPFSEKHNFDQTQLFQKTILHHPLKTVHSKNSKEHYKTRGFKNVARLLTLLWPGYWPKKG